MVDGRTKTGKLVNSLRASQPKPATQNTGEQRTPIASDMYLPNLSGISTHPEMLGEKGFVKKTGDTMTGQLKGILPENKEDFTTKDYVDSNVANPEIDLFFTQDASDISTYFNLDVDLNVTTETTNVTSALANATTLLAAFASKLNEEEIDSIEFLESGIYDMHIHITGGSNNNLSVFFELYHRTSGGTETLLGTSADSNPLTTSDVEYNIHASITQEKIWAVGDRIVIKVYGRNTGVPARNITLAMEGQTTSRIDLPAFLPLSNTIRSAAVLADDEIIIGEGGGHRVQSSGTKVSDLATQSDISDMATNTNMDFRNIGARAYGSGVIPVVDVTFVVMTLNSERWDTDSIHDVSVNRSRMTANKAGKYIITGNVNFENNATGTRIVEFRINGSTQAIARQRSPTSATTALNLSIIWDMAEDDYVEMWCWQNTGVTLNVQSNARFSPELAIHWLGE